MKVSVRKSCYVAAGADYHRYDALVLSGNERKIVTYVAKTPSPEYFEKREMIRHLKPMIGELVLNGFNRSEKLPKLDSSDEYIEINV